MVEVDEVFPAEIPPDSSLILTIGLGLLPDNYEQNVRRHHSTDKGPGISAFLSPPGKAELAPPAWARDRGNRTRPGHWTAGSPSRREPGWVTSSDQSETVGRPPSRPDP